VGSFYALGGNTDVSVSQLLRDSFQFRPMMQELHTFSARERQEENTHAVSFKRGVSVSLLDS